MVRRKRGEASLVMVEIATDDIPEEAISGSACRVH